MGPVALSARSLIRTVLLQVVGLTDKDVCRKVATALMRLANDGGAFLRTEVYAGFANRCAELFSYTRMC